LFQAANATLTRKVTDSTLRSWGRALAARIGLRRSTVAVARKLAIIMHVVWKALATSIAPGYPLASEPPTGPPD